MFFPICDSAFRFHKRGDLNRADTNANDERTRVVPWCHTCSTNFLLGSCGSMCCQYSDPTIHTAAPTTDRNVKARMIRSLCGEDFRSGRLAGSTMLMVVISFASLIRASSYCWLSNS